MHRHATIRTLLTLLALAALPGAVLAAPQAVTLTNGAAVGNLAGRLGTAQLFRILVPPGATKLEIALSDGTGDCDLYVRRDIAPTPQQDDHRSIGPSTADAVRLASPAPGM